MPKKTTKKAIKVKKPTLTDKLKAAKAENARLCSVIDDRDRDIAIGKADLKAVGASNESWYQRAQELNHKCELQSGECFDLEQKIESQDAYLNDLTRQKWALEQQLGAMTAQMRVIRQSCEAAGWIGKS